jgi:hypothetical protein
MAMYQYVLRIVNVDADTRLAAHDRWSDLLPAVLYPELPTGEEGWQTPCWPIELQISSCIRPNEETVVLAV